MRPSQRPQQSLEPGDRIDIVNVFRRPARVGEVVDDCLQLGLPALWLQQGVINEPAAARAVAAGMLVIMDRCIYVDRAALPAERRSAMLRACGSPSPRCTASATTSSSSTRRRRRAVPTPARLRRLADRHTGIGFDQALVL